MYSRSIRANSCFSCISGGPIRTFSSSSLESFQTNGLRHPALQASDEKRIAFSFSGAGFLMPYFIGVVRALTRHGILTDSSPVAGASAGSLIAASIASGVSMEHLMSSFLQVAADCRANGVHGRLRGVVARQIQFVLPPDAHVLCSRRAHVVVTDTWPLPRVRMISEFTSRDDLCAALLTSCHIPFIFDGNYAVDFRGRSSMDGGVSMLIPSLKIRAEGAGGGDGGGGGDGALKAPEERRDGQLEGQLGTKPLDKSKETKKGSKSNDQFYHLVKICCFPENIVKRLPLLNRKKVLKGLAICPNSSLFSHLKGVHPPLARTASDRRTLIERLTSPFSALSSLSLPSLSRTIDPVPTSIPVLDELVKVDQRHEHHPEHHYNSLHHHAHHHEHHHHHNDHDHHHHDHDHDHNHNNHNSNHNDLNSNYNHQDVNRSKESFTPHSYSHSHSTPSSSSSSPLSNISTAAASSAVAQAALTSPKIISDPAAAAAAAAATAAARIHPLAAMSFTGLMEAAIVPGSDEYLLDLAVAGERDALAWAASIGVVQAELELSHEEELAAKQEEFRIQVLAMRDENLASMSSLERGEVWVSRAQGMRASVADVEDVMDNLVMGDKVGDKRKKGKMGGSSN